jgi:predicted CXXCH cytochrome family protein
MAAGSSGSSTLTTDSCAACHRAHTATGEMLIAAADTVSLCLLCHGSTGAGATTNVMDGVTAGTTHGLRAGGFSNAVMDTGWTGTAVSRPVTSAHSIDRAVTVTTWGNGPIGSGPGATSATLTCIDCHNPHGNGSYRILRPIPTGSGAAANVAIADEVPPVYTLSSPLNRYFGQPYGAWAVAPQEQWQWMYSLDAWCAQCHTRYDALEPGTATTDSGDPIFRYRHMTRWPTGWIDCNLCHNRGSGLSAPNPFGITGGATAHEPLCQTCHVAHGSAARMGDFSGGVTWPDGSADPSGDARSSLLRLDNRGVCAGCHDPTS